MLRILSNESSNNCTQFAVLAIEICGDDGDGTRADDCDETN